MHITFVICLLLIIAVTIDAALPYYYTVEKQRSELARDKKFSTCSNSHQDILETLRDEAKKKFFKSDKDIGVIDFEDLFIYEGYLPHPIMVDKILEQGSKAFELNPAVIENLKQSNFRKQFINFDNLSLDNFLEAMESKNILLIEIQSDNLKGFPPVLADQNDKTSVEKIRLKYQLLLVMFVYKLVNPNDLFTIDTKRRINEDSRANGISRWITDISNIIPFDIWALD